MSATQYRSKGKILSVLKGLLNVVGSICGTPLKWLWRRTKVLTLALIAVVGIKTVQAWRGDQPSETQSSDNGRITHTQKGRADYTGGGLVKQVGRHSRTAVPQRRTMASMGVDEREVQPAHPDDSVGALYVKNQINTRQAFGEADIYIPRVEYSAPVKTNSMAGQIRQTVYATGAALDDFSHIGNCMIMVQDATNPKNFVNCHIGFRPADGAQAGKYNIIGGYQTSRICDAGRESASWRKLAGTAFNIKMADDVVMSIQLADDEYEGKMVLGDYEPELPVYPVARRDGVLLVTADKEMRTTAYTDQEEVGAALALAAKTEIEQSPVHDDMFMRPAKAPVVRQTDVEKTVSPKKEVVAEQINRYHNSR